MAMAKRKTARKITTIEELARLMQAEFLGMHSEFGQVHKRFNKLGKEVLELRMEVDDLVLRFDQQKVHPFEIKDLEKRLNKVELKLGLR
jgi:hypothetical protein